MKQNDYISTLLQKHLDGQTNETEEAMVEAHLQAFDHRMERFVDSLNMVDRRTERHARHVSMTCVAGIAASLFLCLGVGTVVYKNTQAKSEAAMAVSQEIYRNPDDAYATTQKALAQFSETLNKGLKPLEQETD